MAQQSLILPAYDSAELRRWAFAAAMVLVAHIAVVGAYMFVAPDEDDGTSDVPAVFIDLTPSPSSSPSIEDAPPGPEASAAAAATKPPERPKPEVADPVEKVEVPAEVTLPVPVPKAKEEEAQQQAPSPNTAPPRAERLGPERPATAQQGNASRAAVIRWNRFVSARLQQNKRYPATAHGEKGTVVFSFVVDPKGQILSQRIVRSSGYPALDNEALALLQRSQPLPAFLPGMTQPNMEVNTSIGFTVGR